MPEPEPRPADAVVVPGGTKPPTSASVPQKDGDEPAEPPPKHIASDPRSAVIPESTMPADELACRDRLKALGVEFRDGKAEHDAAIGCSIPYPLTVSTLGKAVALDPPAELDCAMAEAAARFTGAVIEPAAKSELGSTLRSITQASAFVCRPRHNGQKLSEHAFGNALDIASFTLADGTTVEIGPAPAAKPAAFLSMIRKAACGPFKTVLGPGSDPDHALHFHLDLEPRRNGAAFCQ